MEIIYGTGDYAKRYYYHLLTQKSTDKVKGFVVTENKKTAKLFKKPVWNLCEIKDSINDYTVVVAVSPKKSSEIHDMLNGLGVTNIIQISQDQFISYPNDPEDFISVPTEKNRIFIDCFEGQGFKDNCKYIALYLLENHFDVYMSWDIESYTDSFPDEIELVKRMSPEHYAAFYSSKIIITNSGTEEQLFKKDDQYLINTWHGTGPFKRVGASIPNVSNEIVESHRLRYARADLLISNSADNTLMYRESFLYEGEIAEWGNPRIDYLFNSGEKEKKIIRAKLGISEETGIVLYAPTFREDLQQSLICYEVLLPLLKSSLNRRFKKDFVVLFREHYQLSRNNIFAQENDEWIDVSNYADVMELLFVSDVLITDYSSIMWDFSLLRKPVFLFQPDLDKYIKCERNFYWPVEEWPYPKAISMKELCSSIEIFDDEDYQKRLDEFFIKDPSYDDGHASERLAERIMDVINNPEKYQKILS